MILLRLTFTLLAFVKGELEVLLNLHYFTVTDTFDLMTFLRQ